MNIVKESVKTDLNDKMVGESIEMNEAFKSKRQQRYFFARANDKKLSKKERKRWKDMASEFSERTDFSELPEKKKRKR